MPLATDRGTRRVVMVAHSHVLGGIERHVLALSNALARGGHRVAYAGPLNSWLGDQMTSAGHAHIHLPMHGMYDPLSAWRLRSFARSWKADILHGHGQRGTRYARWAAATRWPVIATAHSTTAWKWFGPNHPIIAVSGAVRDMLLTQGFAADNVPLVHLGVPDAGAAAPPAPGPIRNERPLMLGMLGRMEPVKGHDIALQALRLLSGRVPARLVFIGADTTDWAQRMRALTAELGLGHLVEFWGQRSDIQEVFGRMDVMLLPSRREALSLSLIEGAAAGRPTIGARVGGIPEVIEDGLSGLLVPREDPAALADAIARLAQDDAERLRMGAEARSRFETGFREEIMLERTVTCYDRLLEREAVR
ncbi:glycosyltransferase [Cereibacter johrii]|nr:glycosyltransferase [Cereibacter johrii]